MNSRENIDFGTVLVLAGLAVAFMVLFAFFALLSFVVTILCLFAWRRPLTLGSITITPEEAKGFIGTGCVCVIAALVLLAVFGGEVSPNMVPYLLIGAYTAGSLGFARYIGERQEREAELHRCAPPPPAVRPEHLALSKTVIEDDQPFHFATWDDEEVGK